MKIDISALNGPDVLEDFGSLDYDSAPLRHGVHPDVVITRAGIGMRGLRVIADCVYDYDHRAAHFWRRGMFRMATRRTRRLPDDRRYAIIHAVWSGGYFHWMTESLPRLVELQRADPEATLLLPTHTALTAVQKESVRSLGWDAVMPMPASDNLFVKRLSLVQNPPRKGEYHPSAIRTVRDRLLGHYGDAADRGRRLYVSRRNARGRKVVNEAEVCDYLAELGFVIVEPEALSFPEQARLFASADVLVTIHGAGLTNMLFMPPGGKVLEFIKRRDPARDFAALRRSSLLNPSYARLATLLDHAYVAQLCEPGDPGQADGLIDLTVDMAALRTSLGKLAVI